MKAHVPRPRIFQIFQGSQSRRVPRAAGTALAAHPGRGAFPVSPVTGPARPRVVSAATDCPVPQRADGRPFLVTAQPPRLPGEQFCEHRKKSEQNFAIQSSTKLGTKLRFSFNFRRDFGFLNLETLWDSAGFSSALHCVTAVADFLFASLSGKQRRKLIVRPLVVPSCFACTPAATLRGFGPHFGSVCNEVVPRAGCPGAFLSLCPEAGGTDGG